MTIIVYQMRKCLFFTKLHAAMEETDSIHEVSCWLMHCPNETGLFTRMFLATYPDYLSWTPVFLYSCIALRSPHLLPKFFHTVLKNAFLLVIPLMFWPVKPVTVQYVCMNFFPCDRSNATANECDRLTCFFVMTSRDAEHFFLWHMLESERMLRNESRCFIFNMLEQSTIRIYMWVFICLRLWH